MLKKIFKGRQIKKKKKIDNKSAMSNEDNPNQSKRLSLLDYKTNKDYRIFHNDYDLCIDVYEEVYKIYDDESFIESLSTVEKVILLISLPVSIVSALVNILATPVLLSLSIIYLTVRRLLFNKQIKVVNGYELWEQR